MLQRKNHLKQIQEMYGKTVGFPFFKVHSLGRFHIMTPAQATSND